MSCTCGLHGYGYICSNCNDRMSEQTTVNINCGPMDHADFDEEKFKEAMVKVKKLRSNDK